MFCHKAAETIREKRGRRGFTLIEVLIAMAIFSLGMLAVGTLQITSTNSNASARRLGPRFSRGCPGALRYLLDGSG